MGLRHRHHHHHPRFKEVVTRYIADEALQGAVPLPSHRVSEMSFVLKAVATLISR